MSGFERRRRGVFYAELAPYAAGLLANLCRQLVELLSDGEPESIESADPLEAMLDFASPREQPEDPALRRLFPDAHRGDADVSGEFRRLTEGSLRESKVTDARRVLSALGPVDVTLAGVEGGAGGEGEGATGGGDEGAAGGKDELVSVEVELDAEQARSWMRTLTDLRLTLATRIEFEDQPADFWETLPESDQRRVGYEIFGWLGFLLETLVEAVSR